MAYTKGTIRTVEQINKIIKDDQWMTKFGEKSLTSHLEITVDIYSGLSDVQKVIDGLIYAETDRQKLDAVKAAMRWKEQYL